ncbi:MAG: hypothetical protein GY726_18335 [Proteobacteria bacterium]|nr:hypothetical protein [Pseudomonadota bacterium]
MPQKHSSTILRKLQKQHLREVAATQDFVAQLSAEMLLERVEQAKIVKVGKSSREMLLYERNTGLYAGSEGYASLIDQVPFSMIRNAPEQLRTMLAREQYSLLLSNLAFDWVDAGGFIRLVEYLLKPDGVFWISSYGPQTAANTRLILSKIDDYVHFNAFYDLQEIGDALLGAGFRDVVLESSLLNLEYDSVDALLADAVRVFGVNANPQKRKSLTPKRVLGEFRKQVEAVIEAEGVFSEQVEILIAHGKKAGVPGIRGSIPVRQ